ncbi:polyprenyl diphosphate synthase [Natranaeroarchaeum aerophilus]|uniref:polyprenyl diphosphate synthase n=1 Tax=Natranaeroarchaeum aerophilus TaxID=2917711 RepID=UPI00336A7B5C
MQGWLERRVQSLYEQLLRTDLDEVPTHVAVIQDGNRRYARERGDAVTNGHREGAETTEQVLEWCEELGIEELTLYAFSTENFERPADEREALFDLIEGKLREFADADRVHENGVCIRTLGDIERLPDRVQEVVDYAEERTREYDSFVLNIALAYGGRSELLSATRRILQQVEEGTLSPADLDVETVESQLYDRPVRAVDLIIRTGGDERTSNFLPWYANGNEAAVYFCTPYWPEFSKPEFLRSIRTYQHREQAWQRTRLSRALTLVKGLGDTRTEEARRILEGSNDVPDVDGVGPALPVEDDADSA